MPKRIYSTSVTTSVKPKKAKPKKRMRSNTRYWEDEGDNDGMQHAVNPKPKFVVTNVEDPKKVKRKAKPKAKDPKRGLKAGEMRGTTAQRKSAFNKIAKKRAQRKRRASSRYSR